MSKIFICCGLWLLAAFATALHAQTKYMSDAVLVSNDGKTIKLRSSGQSDKKKTAMEMAVKSAIYTLLYNGVEGVNNGKALAYTHDTNYERRLFEDGRYSVFVGQFEEVGDVVKLGNSYRVKVEAEIYYDALMRDINNSSGVASSHVELPNMPTLTVVPFTRENENVRSLIENNPMLSHAVSKITSEFSKNGYRTKDFISMVQKAKNSDLTTDGSQADAVSMMIQNMSTDIVVMAKINYIPRPNKQGEVSLELNATEKQTATTLASSTFLSGRYMTTDSVRLADYAISKIKKDFFTTLQTAFLEIVRTGRELSVQMVLDQNVEDWDFDQPSPESGEEFKVELEDWLAANAMNGVYDMSRSSDKIIDLTVRIPIWDEKTGRAYSVSTFRNAFRKFLNERLNGEYQASIVTLGQGVVVTIK
ncbi:MAG: DUF6175 family protein [Bacteroides sp.]|nr:DUF6175 family protein [Roseburia sp.]MCM1347095.1 DUF6175 family protein [Bacteroides sp.]MCM1421616.1 DUF6175 family protein [Bacteroides sp.]